MRNRLVKRERWCKIVSLLPSRRVVEGHLEREDKDRSALPAVEMAMPSSAVQKQPPSMAVDCGKYAIGGERDNVDPD
jgi:hypothetical protein